MDRTVAISPLLRDVDVDTRHQNDEINGPDGEPNLMEKGREGSCPFIRKGSQPYVSWDRWDAEQAADEEETPTKISRSEREQALNSG